MSSRRKLVYLVTQNAWESELLTMPLALGYLKAFANADADIRAEVDLRIYNFRRQETVGEMAHRLFADEPPDLLAFSVLGWNFVNFGKLAETYRQVRRDGLCVFGGNHVSNQAERVFRLYPAVDVVVSGEGELSFRALLRHWLAGRPLADEPPAGIAFQEGDRVISTPPPARITDLDRIPSPLLTGAIPMHDQAGRFLYDVALLETNRGCPYKCAFCYWGGAVGQKIHAFSRARLREELEFLAFHGVERLCLCDANFGLLPGDLAFVEDLIDVRAQKGAPRHLVSSWAKNKSAVFYEIVRRLKSADLHTDFTLSLQTLAPPALEQMQRTNMKINQFEDLCAWLEAEGLDVHAELLWGAPGETRASFLAGYDRVATHLSRIATYPLLVLPNTAYHDRRDDHALVTVRDETSDYELVLSHGTVSAQENHEMQRFLFWARLLGEYQVFALAFPAARALAGMSQSEVILSVDDWFMRLPATAGREVEVLRRHVFEVSHQHAVTALPGAVLHTYLEEAALGPLFEGFWHEKVVPRAAPGQRALLAEVFRYDWLSRPYHDAAAARAGAGTVKIGGTHHWIRRAADFHYDVPAAVSALKEGAPTPAPGTPDEVVLLCRVGFSSVVASHEFVPRFRGRPFREVEAGPRPRRSLPARAAGVQGPHLRVLPS